MNRLGLCCSAGAETIRSQSPLFSPRSTSALGFGGVAAALRSGISGGALAPHSRAKTANLAVCPLRATGSSQGRNTAIDAIVALTFLKAANKDARRASQWHLRSNLSTLIMLRVLALVAPRNQKSQPQVESLPWPSKAREGRTRLQAPVPSDPSSAADSETPTAAAAGHPPDS